MFGWLLFFVCAVTPVFREASESIFLFILYARSCFCDAYQGYSSSSTLQTFCASFYASATTQTNPLVTVLSNKNSVNMSGTDFATLANQDTIVSLPSTYSVKVQGSLDVRADGFYRFCVTSSEPATVCKTVLRCSGFASVCMTACGWLRTHAHI
jgi:hypothetical protein